jgi:hypothetical protein
MDFVSLDGLVGFGGFRLVLVGLVWLDLLILVGWLVIIFD